MNILKEAIVSNSEMIKNYKACRERAEDLGKIFILKNNQPDAVLFSITEYEIFSLFIEYLESLDGKDVEKFAESIPVKGSRKTYSLDQLRNDIESKNQLDMISYERNDVSLSASNLGFNVTTT